MTHRFKEHIIMCFTFLPATAIDPNFPRLSHFFFFFFGIEVCKVSVGIQ